MACTWSISLSSHVKKWFGLLSDYSNVWRCHKMFERLVSIFECRWMLHFQVFKAEFFLSLLCQGWANPFLSKVHTLQHAKIHWDGFPNSTHTGIMIFYIIHYSNTNWHNRLSLNIQLCLNSKANKLIRRYWDINLVHKWTFSCRNWKAILYELTGWLISSFEERWGRGK